MALADADEDSLREAWFDVRSYVGQVLQRDGDHEPAAALLEALATEIEAELQERPDNTARLLDTLAGVHLNLGRSYDGLARDERAEATLLIALQSYRQLARVNPEDTMMQLNLSTVHHFLGRMYGNQDKHARSLEHYEATLAIRRDVAERHPESSTFKRDLAVGLDLSGFALRELDRLDEALERHQQAHQAFVELAAARPDYPDATRSVAVSWYYLGLLRRQLAEGVDEAGEGREGRRAHLRESVHAFRASREIMQAERDAGRERAGDGNVIGMLTQEMTTSRERLAELE